MVRLCSFLPLSCVGSRGGSVSLDGTLRSGSCVQGWGGQCRHLKSASTDAAQTDKAIIFGVKDKGVLRHMVLVAS